MARRFNTDGNAGEWHENLPGRDHTVSLESHHRESLRVEMSRQGDSRRSSCRPATPAKFGESAWQEPLEPHPVRILREAPADVSTVIGNVAHNLRSLQHPLTRQGRKAEPVRCSALSATGSAPRRIACANAAWSASVWSAYARANLANAWSSSSLPPA